MQTEFIETLEPSTYILYIVLFQLDRACFQGEERCANFGAKWYKKKKKL